MMMMLMGLEYLPGRFIHIAHIALLGEQNTGVVHLLKLEGDRGRVGGCHLSSYLCPYLEGILP